MHSQSTVFFKPNKSQISQDYCYGDDGGVSEGQWGIGFGLRSPSPSWFPLGNSPWGSISLSIKLG